MAAAQQPVDQPPPVDVHVDVFALMESTKILGSSVKDPVWKIKPLAGRQLIKIPLVIEPFEEPLVLKPSTIRLRGSRFIAWQIVEYEPDDTGAAGEQDPEAEVLAPVAEDAPRLARKITVRPDGVVSWSLARSILGGTVVNSGRGGGGLDGVNLFALRLDPAQLKSRQPKKPNTANRLDIAKFRQQMVEFRELRKRVRSVERDFVQKMPKRLWAIFDAPRRMGDKAAMTITGIQPGTWTLSLKDLTLLRSISALGGGKPLGPGPHARTVRDRLLALVSKDALGQDPHPYTAQAVAFALCQGTFKTFSSSTDNLNQLMGVMGVLLQADDVKVRKMVVEALASMSRPTPASRRLLKKAALDVDPAIQLLALQITLSSSGNLSAAVDESVRFLASQWRRVEPRQVLEALLDKAHADPDNAGPLIGRARLPFDRMRGSRLDNAIVFVISQSVGDPVAAEWLDRRLLGAPQQKLAMRTLEILDRASLGDPVVEPVVEKMLDLWLGPPAKQQSARKITKIVLDGPIPITSSGHSLFRVLQSGHARMRNLAWRQLRLFEIPLAPQSKGTHAEQRIDPYTVFSDVVMAQDQTPSEAADFLARQQDMDQSTLGLVRLVMDATTPRTVAVASRYLVRSNRPIDWALGQLAPDQRQRFALGLYQAYHMEPPLAVALLGRDASREDRILDWFGRYVAENATLPDRVQWGRLDVSENEMLDVVAETEDLELAKAAVDVLVAAAGGGVSQTELITTAMLGKQRHLLTEDWTEHRRKLYLDNIAKVAGSYQLVLYVYEKPEGRRRQSLDANPQQTLQLGTVDLRVAGEKISFDASTVELSVPDDQLAIRIVNLSQLQNLANPQVNKLPLDGVRFLDLLPQDNKLWRGKTTLPHPDLRPIELVMLPSDRQQAE